MKGCKFVLAWNLLLLTTQGLAQTETSRPIVEHVGVGISFNAIADEAIGVVNMYSERSLYHWKLGNFYAGLGLYAGAFNDINSKFNQYTQGRILLLRPLDIIVGHKVHVIRDKISLKTGLSGGIAFFNQKIIIQDERYQVNSSYTYRFREFVAHAKVGASFSLSSRSNLTLYTNLPVINQRLALLGIGLAFNKSI